MNSVHFLTSQSKRNTVDFFSLENQTELQAMRARLSNLQEQLREKDDKLREKEGINLSLQARLNTKNQQLEEKIRQEENLYQKLGAVEEQISQSQAQLREKELEKAKLLKERDRLNGNLRAMHQQLTNSRFSELLKTKMQEQLERKEQQLVESELRLRELNQQLRDLQVQIREKDRAIVALRERFGELEEQLATKEQEKNELERSLSTAQQILRDNQPQRSPDWVIPRTQIQLTTKSLGKGAWGEVVQGRFCGCVVAVKTIHNLILSDYNRRLFEREMDIASRCRHPCLLQFIGATNDDRTPLLLTEVMETSLRAVLEERSLSQTEISVIALDVARGLNYLHQKHPIPILHRDISSANVLLWRQGTQWRAKVSDYGTANFKKQTMTVAPGAPIYSAPEAHATNQTVQVSSD